MTSDRRSPRPLLTLVAATCLITTTGCGLLGRDATATWRVASDQTVTAETTSFTADVTRLGCNSGETGSVRDPRIEESDDAVVITFTVSPEVPGGANCVGNDAVAHTVQLSSPLGDRALIDGACQGTDAEETSSCDPDGVRRPAP